MSKKKTKQIERRPPQIAYTERKALKSAVPSRTSSMKPPAKKRSSL